MQKAQEAPIKNIKKLDRYDDRDDVKTNLLDSYERILAFVQKHLPDPFYLEGTQRISVRDKIFREVVSNILMHREYSIPFPAKIIIGKQQVITENSNKPHGYGAINPNNFSPYPKNPLIAKVFKEIGLADELGSGVRNLVKYVKILSNKLPELIEEDIFNTIIPLGKQDATQGVSCNIQEDTDVTVQATMNRLVEFCLVAKSRSEMQEFLDLKNRGYFLKTILYPLIKQGLLFLTIPDKPTSPNQKYYSKK